MIKKIKRVLQVFFNWTDKVYEAGNKGFRRAIVICILLFLLSIPFSVFKSSSNDSAVLKLNLNTNIVESNKRLDFIQEIQRPVKDWTRNQIISGLKSASKDEKISTLILGLHQLGSVGQATLNDIGQELLHFKSMNKKIIAVSDSFDNSQYYLASFADEIILESSGFGQVMITGFGAFRPYYNAFLNNLKLNLHVFKAGKFKSGPENFSRNTMSEQSKMATFYVLDNLWDQYKKTVSKNIDKPISEIQKLSDQADLLSIRYKGNSEKLALDLGYVDKVLNSNNLNNYFIEKFGEYKESYDHISFRDYLDYSQKDPQITQNEVAIVMASGAIMDGIQENGSIGSESLSEAINTALSNKNTKAIVLRIDSPGGSASASEKIRLALEKVKNKKIPVVVSMGNVAASGAYWIATAADTIFASSSTITGSIGAYGLMLTAENSLETIGVNVDGIGTTKISGAVSPLKPLNPILKTMLQQSINFTYQRFVNLVANARGFTFKEADKIAKGRIWTGEQALKLGLIDQLGGLEKAIVEAAKLAKLSKYSESFYHQKSRFKFLDIFQSGSGLLFNKQLKEIRFLSTLNDPYNLYLSCLACKSFQGL